MVRGQREPELSTNNRPGEMLFHEREALVTDLSKAGGFGAALGVFGTIWDVGEALGPILAGALIGVFVAGTNAYLPAFTIVAALMTLAALAFAASGTGPGPATGPT